MHVMNDDSPKLAKFLAHAGVSSRRAGEKLIADGLVQVNGQVETNVARRIHPQSDTVMVRGQAVLSPTAKPVVVSLYKPVGVVSTVEDPDGKPTVMKYLTPELQALRLYPVGRLDEESEGLLLLTNNGDLAYKLTHPKFQVPRTYQVWISGRLTPAEMFRLRDGIPLKDGLTKPAEVEYKSEENEGQVLQINITEGRHHQVRRMMQAVNHPVIKLKRISHGRYTLGNLPPGKIRLEN